MTDLNMPLKDGYEMTLNIKTFIKDKNIKMVPIISYSGAEMDSLER